MLLCLPFLFRTVAKQFLFTFCYHLFISISSIFMMTSSIILYKYRMLSHSVHSVISLFRVRTWWWIKTSNFESNLIQYIQFNIYKKHSSSLLSESVIWLQSAILVSFQLSLLATLVRCFMFSFFCFLFASCLVHWMNC